MARHNELGAWGERMAFEHLVRHGYAIMEKNARTGHYEVDLIAIKGDTVAFVEVKTRQEGAFDPLEAVTPAKIRRICRAANSFMLTHDMPHQARFDIITVLVDSEGNFRLEHIEDAFRPPLGAGR